jgi:hypothetical protein
MADEESFASRWSARKTAAREEQQQAAIAPAAPEEPPETEPELTAEDLPDIETLDADSDYRVFMADNVPEELRARALRRLWRSSPLFSSMDGLDDYAEDFTDAALVLKEGITSAYKVGRGYAPDPAEAAADETIEAAGEAADDETPAVESEAPAAPDDAPEMADAEGSEIDQSGDDADTESGDELELAEVTGSEPPMEKT